jgi:hypothetical protein
MSLQYQLPPTTNSQHYAAADINRAYVALKLWLLITQNFGSIREGPNEVGLSKESDNSARNVWNELWPPFERIAMSFVNDAQQGNVSVSSTSQTLSVEWLLKVTSTASSYVDMVFGC